MNTWFDFVVSVPAPAAARAQRALAEAHETVARCERAYSEYLPESGVYRLNTAPPGVWVPVAQCVIDLLERAEFWRGVTLGAFDASAKSNGALPADRFRWDRATGRATRLAAPAQLGFGAIGKGFALDRVRTHLEREGFTDFSLSAGGSSIVLSGFSAPETPWTWGWSWEPSTEPSRRGLCFEHPSGIALALGISGETEQPGHLIDRAGESERNSDTPPPLSALVAVPSAADADALSTALFVAGFDGLSESLRNTLVPPALATIEADHVPRWNGIFRNLWGDPAVVVCSLAACFLARPLWSADEAVDLSALGLGNQNVYQFEREPLWVLLPLFSLLLIAWHLKRSRRPKSGAMPPKEVE